MCGIAGIVNLNDRHEPPSLDVLKSMAATIQYRGPDEFGVYRDHRAGFAHARLSIIDLSTGQQPLANEDETLWIVFNGEIFNFVELRDELEELGHRFNTQSDTEVIVHAYEAWGERCFSRFNGQWAIALWDTVRQSLILCRDRVGAGTALAEIPATRLSNQPPAITMFLNFENILTFHNRRQKESRF